MQSIIGWLDLGIGYPRDDKEYSNVQVKSHSGLFIKGYFVLKKKNIIQGDVESYWVDVYIISRNLKPNNLIHKFYFLKTVFLFFLVKYIFY